MAQSSKKRKLLIATSNPGKFDEIMEILAGLPFDFLSLRDVKAHHGFEEDGQTHEENALKKASHYYKQTGLLTLGEDSGIMVDALDGQLGVKTRRWGAGEKASDEEWIKYFLEAMKDVPQFKRTARFICCAALVGEQGSSKIFLGKTNGIITYSLEAPIKAGLPLSSCFRPEGADKVYAALSVEEKNRVSHRGKAIKMALEYLSYLRAG